MTSLQFVIMKINEYNVNDGFCIFHKHDILPKATQEFR